MKVAGVVCLVAVLAACSNARSPTEPRDWTVALRFGQTVTVPGTSMTISFTDIADSRCPASVVCVWEGDAAIRLESNGEVVVLHTSKSAGSSTSKLRTVSVALLDVKPPRLTPDETSKSEYVVTIRVTQ
jgi:hypothetical protein